MATKTKTETRQLDGCRLWNRKKEGLPGWSSADGSFDILEAPNGTYCVLVSFEHDQTPGDDCEFWRKRFRHVADAMEHAEKM